MSSRMSLLVVSLSASLEPLFAQVHLWDMQQLSEIPFTESAEAVISTAKTIRWTESNQPPERPAGVQAIWLKGLDYKGGPTKIFAWVGVPESSSGSPVPGMVLVHGGGGTAFAEWVAMWNRRGYAAIAIDTSGRTPRGADSSGHAFAGPGHCGDFKNADLPDSEQWTYHAVSAVILAHTYLRSLEGVDSDRTGITGISWGGYLTCIAAAVDPRFKVVVPVYGCGFLGENSAWTKELNAVDADKRKRWLTRWDPSVYIASIQAPILWVAFSNDTAYPLDSLQKSYRLLKTPCSLCVLVEFGHSHACGWSPPEIAAFVDQTLRPSVDHAPLPVITAQGREENIVWVEAAYVRPITRVDLYTTADSGAWEERKWVKHSQPVVGHETRFSCPLPEGVTVYYVNLVDDRGLVASSQHEVRVSSHG